MKITISARPVATAILGLVATGVAPSGAQNAEELIESRHVMIRHRLEPAEPVFVGQPVRIWIEVMTRTWFLQAPRYPTTVEVRNAIVIPPEAFEVNASERIGGETYAVQGRAYTVFPQRAGRFEVPPIGVTLVVAREDASRSPEIELRTEPVTVEARLPAGAEGRGLVLSTPALTIDEQYSRPFEGLRVGDSFRRQVTMTIQDSVAMLLPPIPFEAEGGVAVYPGRPEVTDRRNRGQLTGTRVDEATYVMEAEGTYRLPAITFWWWNLKSSSLEQEILPEAEFRVAANPDLAPEHLGEPEEGDEALADVTTVAGGDRSGWRTLGELLAGALLMVYLAWHVREWTARRVRRRKLAAESEAAYFRRFVDTAGTGDPSATHAALIRWLDRFAADGGVVTVRDFVTRAGDEELEQQYGSLQGLLFGRSEPATQPAWSAPRFARAVTRARRRLTSDRPKEGSAHDSLPPLNPKSLAFGRKRARNVLRDKVRPIDQGGMK